MDKLVKTPEVQIPVEEKESTVVDVLIKSEEFEKAVVDSFFKVTSESDPKDGSEKFMSYIKGNFDTSSINQFYSQCLQGLQRSYSREILLSILADASETLEDSSKDLIKSQESFQKVCDLVHIRTSP